MGNCDPRKGAGRAQDANGVRRTMGASPGRPGRQGREVTGLESVPDQNLAAANSAAQRIPLTALGSRTAFGEACRAPRSA